MTEDSVDRLKVEVLLREYDTLRTEILARVRTRFELLGFLAIITAFAGSRDSSTTVAVTVAAVALLIAIVVWIWFARGIKRCAVRILEIETKVNELLDDDLLRWESSLPRDSWWRRFIR